MDLLHLHMSMLQKYFKCESVDDPFDNPLFAATDSITADLENLLDMCSNRNGTGNLLEQQVKFFKLTRVR